MTTPRKRGIKPGTKFSPEHRAAISRGMRASPKVAAHMASLKILGKGVNPSPQAHAGSRATRRLKTMGLTRTGSPSLWEHYRKHYLSLLTA